MYKLPVDFLERPKSTKVYENCEKEKKREKN